MAYKQKTATESSEAKGKKVDTKLSSKKKEISGKRKRRIEKQSEPTQSRKKNKISDPTKVVPNKSPKGTISRKKAKKAREDTSFASTKLSASNPSNIRPKPSANDKDSSTNKRAKKRKSNFAHVRSRLFEPTKANLSYKKAVDHQSRALKNKQKKEKGKQRITAQNDDVKIKGAVCSAGTAVDTRGTMGKKSPKIMKKNKFKHIKSLLDTGRVKTWKPKRNHRSQTPTNSKSASKTLSAKVSVAEPNVASAPTPPATSEATDLLPACPALPDRSPTSTRSLAPAPTKNLVVVEDQHAEVQLHSGPTRSESQRIPDEPKQPRKSLTDGASPKNHGSEPAPQEEDTRSDSEKAAEAART